MRERLPGDRNGITKSFQLAYAHSDGRMDTMKFYFTVSMYPDGRPGEVFIRADRPGSMASGALDAAAMMISLLLQNGVPLRDITAKLRHTRYQPQGYTKDPMIPSCTSPLDLLAQWLELKFPLPLVDG